MSGNPVPTTTTTSSRAIWICSARTRRCRRTPPAIPADLLALSTPKYNGAWVFTDSENRKPFDTQKNIFLPRIGVAIRVNDKTAVNVGFARYVGADDHRQTARTSANTLAACTWCPGFNQISNSAAVRRRPPAGVPVESVPGRFESAAVADRQEPRGVHQRRQRRQLGRSELSTRRSTIASTSRSCGRFPASSKWMPPGS